MLVTHSVDEAALLGSRIIVLSPRPGTVVLDERSELPRAEHPRTEPAFAPRREQILAAVRGEAHLNKFTFR
ncbi:hypothetical protein [Catellatospora tritici]|uniref:hypothetical protein n=1 Tax=Catellatospora tritici TaxID=2851566 RepID=UPI0020C3E8FD|nr:hypothetical protein [Catellatospora tritici]